MMHPAASPCSIFCILPPGMLSNLVINGPAALRERTLTSLDITQSLVCARIGYDESQRSARQMRRVRRLALRNLLDRLTSTGENKQRTIYSANNTQRIPGTRVRSEGDPPTGDLAVDEAYDYMGKTYDFYYRVFNRNSIDDEGMPLNGTVHFGNDYDNAFWDGQRMIYGDGDGALFERFTIAIDVIGHELTHGVTQFEAGLIYWGQPGALNEHISDVFGSLIKQFANNQTAQAADWIIGEGLFTPAVHGVGIRSMKAPGTAYNDPVLGKDPQPAHMNNYVRGLQDNGGVHINSGIPNHAFYLAATKMGGYAWEKAGQIWYETLLTGDPLHPFARPLLRRTAKFIDFARITTTVAQTLFPGGTEAQAVRESWAEVGIVV